MRCQSLTELPPPPPGKTGWPWTNSNSKLQSSPPTDRTWPRISIITPSYNQGSFIEETIRSVLLQGYPDLEYIIIDGGSNDNTLDIIKKYDCWLGYWVSEPDHGQAQAINKGFKKASGEIIAWLNSDDLYTKGTLQEVGSFFSYHHTVDFLYGACIFISSKGKTIKKYQAVPFDLNAQLLKNMIAQPSVFFKKHVFHGIGFLDENLHFSFDVDFWLKAGLKYSFQNYPTYLSKFRFHEKSKSVRSIISMKTEATMAAIHCLENIRNDQIKYQILRVQYLMYAILLWRMNRKNLKQIAHTIEKAKINNALFQNEKFVLNIALTFMDLNSSKMIRIDNAKIKEYINDITEFYLKYIYQNIPDRPGKYLSQLISRCYFELSLYNRNPVLYIRGIINNPFYFLKLFIRQLKKYLF